jgi:hypothetical protein
MIIFYQDRLGTTLGKALKKEWRFLRALDASAWRSFEEQEEQEEQEQEVVVVVGETQQGRMTAAAAV